MRGLRLSRSKHKKRPTLDARVFKPENHKFIVTMKSASKALYLDSSSLPDYPPTTKAEQEILVDLALITAVGRLAKLSHQTTIELLKSWLPYRSAR